jgi:hypothetical protein
MVLGAFLFTQAPQYIFCPALSIPICHMVGGILIHHNDLPETRGTVQVGEGHEGLKSPVSLQGIPGPSGPPGAKGLPGEPVRVISCCCSISAPGRLVSAGPPLQVWARWSDK